MATLTEYEIEFYQLGGNNDSASKKKRSRGNRAKKTQRQEKQILR